MRNRSRAALGAAVLVLGASLSGCSEEGSSFPVPGPSRVDVDTPELRAAKDAAGIETCADGPATDGPLPDLTLPCLGGGPGVDLATLEGPLVINLWQAFCEPCETELPALQSFHEQHGERVPVLGVDYLDVRPDAALELAERSGVTYPLVADPGGDIEAADPFPVVRGLPYLLFLDADGAMAAHTGGVESAAELVELANEHLGTEL